MSKRTESFAGLKSESKLESPMKEGDEDIDTSV